MELHCEKELRDQRNRITNLKSKTTDCTEELHEQTVENFKKEQIGTDYVRMTVTG